MKPDVDNTKTINILSLCTGYGGLELGLAGALEGVFRVVAVEVEAYALANLAAKAQEGKLAIEAMWPDLKTFPAERFRGCFDFILAGYPCQPFSVAGKRKGTGDPRHLWPHIARIVQAVRPVWCFFENVSGHLTIGYPEVYRSLRDMGFGVEAGIFGTWELGFWHQRERIFILAHTNGSMCTSWADKLQTYKWPFSSKKKRHKPTIWCKTKGCHRNKCTEGYVSKPLLDRRVNGPACRVDRLRLLGNGVVPQQAEKAFRHLIGKFE